MTKSMNYSQVRANFAAVLDTVVDNAEEVIVTRSGRGSAVVVSLEEWESLKETAHLMRSPANANRLRQAIADLDAGRGVEHELVS